MSEIIARVNGVPIMQFDLNTSMQSLVREQYGKPMEELTAEESQKLSEIATERLLARELIHQAALAEGLVASEEDVRAEQNRVVRIMGNIDDFLRWLNQAGLSEVDFQRMIRKDVTVDRMTTKRLEAVADPDDGEIRNFFDSHPEMMQMPERVRASHILIPLDEADPETALAEARRIREEAMSGDFAELAKTNSACPTSTGGGDIGFFRREDMDPAFAAAAFSQEVDVIGEPVRTAFGYHLIKVTEREAARPMSVDEARPKIVNYLRREKGSRLLEAWVAELRAAAKVELQVPPETDA